MSKEAVASAPAIADKDKATAKDILAYGLGGAACTMPAQFKTSFSMFFLTNIALLDPLRVGFWISLMTIWDAINDPIIGGIADRTNTKRWGKYRPHMMIGSVMWGIVTILLFSAPNLTGRSQMTYYVIMLAIFSVFYTQFTVPWQALNSVMSSDPHQRNLLLTSRQLAGFFAGSLATIITVPIVRQFAEPKNGYLFAAVIVAVVCAVTGLLSAYGVRRKDYYNSIPTPKKVGIGTQFSIVFKNRAVICAAVLLGLVTLVNAMNAALSMYYLTYVVGNDLVMSYTSIITMVSSLLIIPLMPVVLKKLGKIPSLLAGMSIVMLSAIPLIFLRENATTMQILGMSLIAAVGFTISNMTCMSLIPDCTDYTELKFGTNQAGFVNAVITFMKKMCQSASTIIVGALLAVVGYSAATAEGDVAVRNMILTIKIWYPIILLVLTIIILKIYPITKSYGVEMRAQLKVMREENAKKLAAENE